MGPVRHRTAPAAAAGERLVGTVRVVGSAPVNVKVVLRPSGGGDVELAGPLAEELRRLPGAEVAVSGPVEPAPDPLADRRVRVLLGTARARCPGLRHVLGPEDLDGTPIAEPHPAGPDDPALYQLTSGSTGTPKGVVITQANVAANVAARSARNCRFARTRSSRNR